MSAFDTFVQLELPKRPYLDTDPAAETVMVRRGAGPRQLAPVALAEGQVLAMVNGALVGTSVSSLSGAGVQKAVYTVTSALATWTIGHNLNSENLIVQAFDESKFVIIPSTIQIVSANTVQLTFNTPQAGVARVIFLDAGTGSYTGSGAITYAAINPTFSNVGALLHLDGLGFTDSSSHAFTVNNVSSVTADASSFKFGSASASLNGNGQYLWLAHDAALDVGGGDCTMECWINIHGDDSTGRARGVISKRVDGGDTGWSCYITTGSNPKMALYSSTSGTQTGTTVLSQDTWHHVAWVISGSNLLMFVDGSLDLTTSYALASNSYPLHIGANRSDVEYFAGHIDEVRVTKGTAVYTSSFAAPAGPFPNS